MEEFDNREISFKEVLMKIRILFNFMLSKWYLFLIMGIIGGVLGLEISFSIKPKYSGRLTFVLSTETKASGISGLASQFGLDLGTAGGGDLFSGDNIITLFQSKKMIKPVLLKVPPGEKDNLGNLIVKEWKWNKAWSSNIHLKNNFPFPNDLRLLNSIQDSLLSEVYNNVIKNHLTIFRSDKKLSIYELTTISSNEKFSCYLTKFLMDETADFYINTKTSVAKNNLIMLQREADSLGRLLGRTITSTASEVDRTFNLNPALQIQRSSIQKGQFNANVLGTAYGEVVKNLELAKINLQRETPLYQIIDYPELPLKSEKISKWNVIIVGIIIGMIITFFLLFIKFYMIKDKKLMLFWSK